jgi:uncharacterized protein YecE (DUF72 family)
LKNINLKQKKARIIVEFKIGCAGWSYPDWKNVFYPKNMPQSQWLSFYAEHFSFTEINTTFYQLPDPDMVKNWKNAVPDSFRFSVKLWQQITHDSASAELDDRIDQFFIHLSPLKPKISGILLQFPPRFSFSDKHSNQILRILKQLPSSYHYYLELRDDSWFVSKKENGGKSEIESLITDFHSVYIATSYLEGFSPFFPRDQSVYYIRLVGDRLLEKFNKIQRNQTDIIEELNNKINKLTKEREIDQFFILFNNHFRGFAPQDAFEFGNRLGIIQKPLNAQKTLDQFFPLRKPK